MADERRRSRARSAGISMKKGFACMWYGTNSPSPRWEMIALASTSSSRTRECSSRCRSRAASSSSSRKTPRWTSFWRRAQCVCACCANCFARCAAASTWFTSSSAGRSSRAPASAPRALDHTWSPTPRGLETIASPASPPCRDLSTASPAGGDESGFTCLRDAAILLVGRMGSSTPWCRVLPFAGPIDEADGAAPGAGRAGLLGAPAAGRPVEPAGGLLPSGTSYSRPAPQPGRAPVARALGSSFLPAGVSRRPAVRPRRRFASDKSHAGHGGRTLAASL